MDAPRRVRSLSVAFGPFLSAALAASCLALDPWGTSDANDSMTVVPEFAATSYTEPDDYHCTFWVKLYDPVEITSLKTSLVGFTCVSDVPGVTLTYKTYWLPPHIRVENFPAGFHGPAVLMHCYDDVPHWDCPAYPDWQPIVYEAYGPAGRLAEVPTLCPSVMCCNDYCPDDYGPFVADACGDPDRSGHVRASDALFVLRASVSASPCTPAQCDADRDGTVDATDALRILRYCVGADVVLACPPPCGQAGGVQ